MTVLCSAHAAYTYAMEWIEQIDTHCDLNFYNCVCTGVWLVYIYIYIYVYYTKVVDVHLIKYTLDVIKTSLFESDWLNV